jgi:AraC-like DNA-binding protein
MAQSGIAIDFARSAIDSTRAAGFDVRPAMREVHLPAAAFHPGTTHLDCHQAVALTRALWRLADDELLHQGPRPVPRGTFRMIALGLIHAPDLRTALERLVDFLSLTTGYPGIRMIVDGRTCRIEIGVGPGVVLAPFAAEILLVFAHRFAAWLSGQRLALSGLDLPFPEPAYSAEYEQVFGRRPSFGAPAASICFDAALLDAPLVREESDLLDYFRRWPEDLIFHRDYGTAFADRVRKVLEHGDAGHRRSADEVAARLSVSTQHMRRLLRREGTSFAGIREEVLRDLAIAGLQAGRHSIEELSHRLGFSEPSAFRRAFARWVGTPPGEYRDRLAVSR